MTRLYLSLFLIAACGSDADSGKETTDASISVSDASVSVSDASTVDAAPSFDAALPDAQSSAVDAAQARSTLVTGFCPSSVTAPGLYEGTLASNLNDVSGCASMLSAPGRDGAVRLELTAGQTVSAVLRHAGDGALYILDSCPVISSCLDSSDQSISGSETVSYTNDTGATNTVYVILDSDDLAGPQTFELDLVVN